MIGGHAVALHGHPCYIRAIEIWIEMTPENAARVVATLEQFGLDRSASRPGVEFAPCCASRVELEIEGLAVCFIDLENLRKSKQASRRLQDLADVENLQQTGLPGSPGLFLPCRADSPPGADSSGPVEPTAA